MVLSIRARGAPGIFGGQTQQGLLTTRWSDSESRVLKRQCLPTVCGALGDKTSSRGRVRHCTGSRFPSPRGIVQNFLVQGPPDDLPAHAKGPVPRFPALEDVGNPRRGLPPPLPPCLPQLRIFPSTLTVLGEGRPGKSCGQGSGRTGECPRAVTA